MAKLRAAVIGAGRLGTLHAHKYEAIDDVQLAFVADIDRERAETLARETGARAVTDYRELAGKVDLATVASPSITHHEVAAAMLAAGIDVLLEKPMAASLEEARKLAHLAVEHRRVFQIGHLERFNPAIVRLRSIVSGPRFVECHRLAPFTERGTDVDVVLDLMVHDLDVILSLAPANAVSVEAVGVAVLTDSIDVANARIRFDNGLIANISTSRVAPRRERKIRFFQPDAYISVDYEARRVQIIARVHHQRAQVPVISADQLDLGEGDRWQKKRSFVDAVRTRGTLEVSAEDGLRVMELSERIRKA